METVLIQINDKKAYKILEGLEELNIITILQKNVPQQKKLSKKYSGKIPVNIANELNAEIDKSRKEWDKRNI